MSAGKGSVCATSLMAISAPYRATTVRSSRNSTLIVSVARTASAPRVGSYGSAALAQGCEAQFKLGYFHINKRVRQRHYLIVDTERGVVVATGFFDHDNAKDTYMTTDGKVQKTLLKFPNSLSLMEAFKIRNGKIYRVEAIFTYVPYYMQSPVAGSGGCGRIA